MQDQQRARGGMARRGVLAAVAALAAGGLTKATERKALAANGDALTAGNAFTETAAFRLTNTSGTVSAPDPTSFVGGPRQSSAPPTTM